MWPLLRICALILFVSVRVSVSIVPQDVVDKNLNAAETVLSTKDFENAPVKDLDLRKIGIHVPDDPTMGSKAEGDIAIPNFRRFMDDQSGLARNSIRQPYRRWPNNEIPYTLSTQYGTYSRSVIAKAMNEYHTKTCVKFIPRDAKRHRDYVYIHPDDGCYSLVGRVGGRQPLSLDSGCIQTGTIVHELMHTVGFFHEQSRYDRDQFIDIMWPNVVNGADDQFEKYGMNVIDQLNEPYDYASIMHYGPFAFSSNGKRTIVARKNGAQRMGQRVQFSDIDLRKINRLYMCDQRSTGTAGAGSTPPRPQMPPISPHTLTQVTHFTLRPSGSTISITSSSASTSSETATTSATTSQSSIPTSIASSPTSNSATPNITTLTVGTSIGISTTTISGPILVTSVVDAEECSDKNWRCEFWALPMLGYCDQFPELRRVICPVACGICSPQRSADNAIDEEECADRSAACSRVHVESCVSPLTRVMCPKICGLCGPRGCTDVSDAATCHSVRMRGLCAARPDCLRSCGLC